MESAGGLAQSPSALFLYHTLSSCWRAHQLVTNPTDKSQKLSPTPTQSVIKFRGSV